MPVSEINLSAPPVNLNLAGIGIQSTADALRRATDAGKIEKAAKGFEAIFLNKIFEEMERTIPKSGLLDSAITKQVQGMFWFYLAQDMADKGGVGLWKDIQKQMMTQYSPSAETKPTVEVES